MYEKNGAAGPLYPYSDAGAQFGGIGFEGKWFGIVEEARQRRAATISPCSGAGSAEELTRVPDHCGLRGGGVASWQEHGWEFVYQLAPSLELNG